MAVTTVDTEEICPRSDLPASMCSHCRGLPWTAPRDESETDIFDLRSQPGPWFTARHDGWCTRHEGAFEAGTRIRRDGRGAYECCGERLDVIGVG